MKYSAATSSVSVAIEEGAAALCSEVPFESDLMRVCKKTKSRSGCADKVLD